MVNKLRLKVILLITFLSFNLLTGADSPFSGKRFEAIPHLSSFQISENNQVLSPKAARSSFGISYQSGSGDYTASGGFALGKSGLGLAISASKDGYASLGLNYSKEGKSLQNYFSGGSLNIGSDGQITLSNQFRGADVFSLGYNTNTHSFSPIGVNGNFQSDFLANLVQENAAHNSASSAEKLADIYGNVLVERGVITAEKMGELMTKQGGHEELISLYDTNKQAAIEGGPTSQKLWEDSTNKAVEQLRSEGLNISMGGQSQGGFFNDLFNSFQQSMGYAMDGNGGLDENGAFSISTCFTAGTLIHTKTGTKKIEEIAIGDQVLSWNEETGEQEYNKVTATFVRDTNEIYTLIFADGKQVETTWNHPFRRLLPEYSFATTPTKVNSEWVEAKDLKVGDLTFTKDGKLLQIGFIHVDEREETVYNFTVENDHDYYVGEVGILVHNVDCPLTTTALFGNNPFLDPGTTAGLAKKLIESGVDTVKFGLDVAACFSGHCDNIGKTLETLGTAIDKMQADPAGTSAAAKEALSKFKASLLGENGSIKQGEAIGSLIDIVPWVGLGKSAGSIFNMMDDAGKLISKIETKILKQMEKRGWTVEKIDSVVNSPSKMVDTWDTRWKPDGSKVNDPATAYINADGSYVVRNNRTGEIVQVSDRFDPNWKAPW
ncbi:TIGR04388 family protein [Leptospira kmetyi]|uniref:TIGR04388 family protein n=1 Tax=Leptospira kmetyi TaxID=408139 RepID=UPI0010827A71|nr:TIGR04388 family protein [Leptospira kmetyi]TGL66538.1 TIGR04388 family protein [Leptospira kmetyi]